MAIPANSRVQNVDKYQGWVTTLLYLDELPKEWYLQQVDLKADQQHFESMLSLAMNLSIVSTTLTMACIIIVFLIGIVYCSARNAWNRLEVLEEEQKNKLSKYEKKERERIREEEIELSEKERDFMFMMRGQVPPQRARRPRR